MGIEKGKQWVVYIYDVFILLSKMLDQINLDCANLEVIKNGIKVSIIWLCYC